MKIFALGINPQLNSIRNKKESPSFQANVLVSDGAKAMLKFKLIDFYSKSDSEIRNQFFKGFKTLDQTIVDFQNAFAEQTKDAKGTVIIARDIDPESEEFLRVLYQYPDKRIRKIGYMSPYEILPNEFRDGSIKFGNTIKKIVSRINFYISLDPRTNESIAFAKLNDSLGKSGSELISEM